MRSAPVLALPLVVVALAACPPDPEETATDGGVVDARPLPCAEQGIPCTLAEVSAEANARTNEVLAEIDAKLQAGEPIEDVAAFVQAHEHVADIGITTKAFWFRVDGGRPHSVIDGSRRDPGGLMESQRYKSAQGVVEHPDAEDTPHNGEQKRALFLDPFRWQMPSNHEELMAKLGETRDYERAGAIEARAQATEGDAPVGPGAFLGWREYDLLMVTTHGLASKSVGSEVRHNLLFSSARCPNHDTALAGEAAGLGADVPGLSCSRMVLAVPNAQGDPEWIVHYLVAMDESFFAHAYPSGLRSQIAVLDACHSAGLDIAGEGAVLGWTDTVRIASAVDTMDALFQHLVTDGLTLFDSMSKLQEQGLDAYSEDVAGVNGPIPTNPALRSRGEGMLRVREVVHLLDPVTGGVISDSSLATLDVELPGDGTTSFSIDVLVDGVLPLVEPYTLRIYDDEAGGSAPALAGPLDIPIEGEQDGEVLREQVELNLPREVVDGEELRLRAELELPYGGVSTHTTSVFLLVESDPAWSLSFPETLGGERILAPVAQSIPSDDGEVIWHLLLTPTIEDQGPPLASLFIKGHTGRQPDCSGPLGTFETEVVAESSTHIYAGEGATLEITRFDEVAFQAMVSGTAERLDKNDPDAQAETVTMTGSVDWAGSGCSEQPDDPGVEEFYGSSRVAEQPFVCTDNWAGSMYDSAESFFEICAAGDLICSSEPCTDEDRLAQCDFRNPGAPMGLAGTVHSYYQGIEATVADLEQGCTTQAGIFTAE